jgi:predicted enzyme related to lactoylglutathione lyase
MVHVGRVRRGEIMVTGIDVHIYNVKDFNRALQFYTGLIGKKPEILREGTWAEFELSDGSAFAIGKHENFPWQPGYTILFAVPDVKEAADYVNSHGGKAGDPGEGPVCYMSFGEDTEGNQLVLHKRKPS